MHDRSLTSSTCTYNLAATGQMATESLQPDNNGRLDMTRETALVVQPSFVCLFCTVRYH